ncbi:hypothetical protein TRVA0_007S00276 [Trichomonascus vanleenenianus]|uniref:DEAD/DEAH box helicase n=1 Tax=Trichomonascus vanleenenianus TaxID=2268995 RepID=UPI003ECB58A1
MARLASTPGGAKQKPVYDSSGSDSGSSDSDSSDNEAINDLISNGSTAKPDNWNNTTALGSLSYAISTSPKKIPQKVPLKKKKSVDGIDVLGDKLGKLNLNKPDLEPPKNSFFSKLQAAQHRHHDKPKSSGNASPGKNAKPDRGEVTQRTNSSEKNAAAGLRHSRDHYKLAKDKAKHRSEQPTGNGASKFNTPEKSFQNTPVKQYEDTKTFSSPAQRYNSFKSSFLTPMTPSSKQWGHRITPAELYKPVPISSPAPQRSVPEEARWGTKPRKDDFSAFVSGNSISNTVNYPGSSAFEGADDPKEAVLNLLESLKADDDAKEDGSNVIEGLLVPLLPHQVKGVRFLKKRESRKLECKGGLLCDDMGLGKTVQSISLILSNQKKKKTKHDKVKEEEVEKTTTKKEKKEEERDKKDKKTEENDNEIKTTLVVCPLALTTQWAEEIQSKAPGLRVYIHHGPQREKTSSSFHHYDVIITTFNVLAAEGRALVDVDKHNGNANKNDSAPKKAGPLFDKQWWRVILDEAHTIKNQDSKTAKAAFLIKSDRRWCLTGTPVQNNIDDLYSLIRFIRAKPYNDYVTWATKIGDPLKKGKLVRSALDVLHVLLSVIMLRRTKAVLGPSGVILPPRRRQIVKVHFDTEHRRAYDDIQRRARDRANQLLENKVFSAYLATLTILLRLRQACDHIKLARDGMEKANAKPIVQKSTKTTDPNSADDLADLLGGLKVEDDDDFTYDAEQQVEPSPKMDALMELLEKEPGRKTIVFSQFTSMMDLVAPHFRKKGIRFVRYDGKMNRATRDEALEKLKKDKKTTVLLCSLKCGALGLNLTVASRVIILDPWWNPMIIEQAIDRVHRLGQTVPVDVYELVIENSVEEKIMALQEQKRNLAEGVLSGENKLVNQLTQEELEELLQ